MKFKKLSNFFLLLLFCLNAKAQLVEVNNKLKCNEKLAIIEIEKIYKRVISGETIEEIAEQVSQDPGTFLRGGVIGFVNPLEKYEESFFLAIQNLEIDEISKPFKSVFGYHIAKVIMKKSDKMIIQHILIRVYED